MSNTYQDRNTDTLVFNTLAEVTKKAWTSEEKASRRRLVQAYRKRINAPLDAATTFISCIFWEETGRHVFTSPDFFKLAELLFCYEFDTEQKKILRRDLDRLTTFVTIKKKIKEHRPFFDLVMGFPDPKPTPSLKDFKVFPWESFESALTIFPDKYDLAPPEWVSYSSPPSSFLLQNIPVIIPAPRLADPFNVSPQERTKGVSPTTQHFFSSGDSPASPSLELSPSSSLRPLTDVPTGDHARTWSQSSRLNRPLSFDSETVPEPTFVCARLHWQSSDAIPRGASSPEDPVQENHETSPGRGALITLHNAQSHSQYITSPIQHDSVSTMTSASGFDQISPSPFVSQSYYDQAAYLGGSPEAVPRFYSTTTTTTAASPFQSSGNVSHRHLYPQAQYPNPSPSYSHRDTNDSARWLSTSGLPFSQSNSWA